MERNVPIALPPADLDGRSPRLAQIAELVGLPIEAFFREDDGAALAFGELLRAWQSTDAAGRARLLAVARDLSSGGD